MSSLSSNVPDGTFVEAVARLVQPVPTVHGVYNEKILVVGDKVTHIEDPSLPKPEAITTSTLQSVVDFMGGFKGKPEVKTPIIHVKSPICVQIVAPFYGDMVQNLVYLTASPVLPSISFNAYLNPEDFLIQLMSRFAESDERLAVQKTVGNFKSGLMSEIDDDGVTQSAATRRGVQRTEETPVKNPVLLAPFRTFREVSQPVSEFVLRMKQVQNGNEMSAQAALIEADGGAWQATAIGRIGTWLKEKIGGEVTILA